MTPTWHENMNLKIQIIKTLYIDDLNSQALTDQLEKQYELYWAVTLKKLYKFFITKRILLHLKSL